MASADGRNFVSNRSQERSPVGAGDDGGSGKTVLSAAFASYVSYILGKRAMVLDFDYKEDAIYADEDKIDILSQREKEIIICIAKGLSNKEISDVLNISINTVTTHRRNISSKLQIHSIAGITIYAIANGLVQMSEIEVS